MTTTATREQLTQNLRIAKHFGWTRMVEVNTRLIAKLDAEETAVASTEDRIIAAYHRLAPAPGELVSLAKLRAEIADIAKGEQDRALKALDRARVLNLESDPNRKALPDDVADWQMVVGGQPYHLVYLA